MDTVDSIYREYSARCNEIVPLRLGRVGLKGDESFHVTGSHRGLKVTAESQMGAALGLSLAGAYICSGEYREAIGVYEQKFPWRVLSLQGDKPLTSDSLQRVIELGYNAVITDQEVINPFPLTLIKKISIEGEARSPLDQDFQSKMHEACKNCEAVYWESGLDHPSYLDHPDADTMTYAEVLLKELRLIEQSPVKRVFFYFHSKHRRARQWLNELACNASNKTVIMFPENQPQFLHISGMPFLPTFDIEPYGAMPAIPKHLYISNDCLGAAVCVKSVPKMPTMQGARLWLFAQSFIQKKSSSQLLKTWIKCYHPHWAVDHNQFFDAGEIIHQSLSISKLENQQKGALKRLIQEKIRYLEFVNQSSEGEVKEMFQKFCLSMASDISLL